MSDWMQEVTYEMLPDNQKNIADVIGVEATLKLCEVWGGDELYIPQNEKVKKHLRDRQIRRLYAEKGYKVTYLKQQYGLSGRMVRGVVQEARPEQLKMDV